MSTTLVAVRYPLTSAGYRTIQRGVELADQEGGSLLVLHVSLLQNKSRISRQELRQSVESELGEINAHYVVRQGYVLEEALVDEVARQDVDRVLLGQTRRGPIRRRLGRLLGLYPDLEAELRQSLNTTLEVVD